MNFDFRGSICLEGTIWKKLGGRTLIAIIFFKFFRFERKKGQQVNVYFFLFCYFFSSYKLICIYKTNSYLCSLFKKKFNLVKYILNVYNCYKI